MALKTYPAVVLLLAACRCSIRVTRYALQDKRRLGLSTKLSLDDPELKGLWLLEEPLLLGKRASDQNGFHKKHIQSEALKPET